MDRGGRRCPDRSAGSALDWNALDWIALDCIALDWIALHWTAARHTTRHDTGEPAMADRKRLHRLLQMISLLQSDAGWTADALAGHLQTSTRTIYRDFRTLRDAGVPVETQSGRATISGDFFMPPLQLTAEEALALAVLCRPAGDPENLPVLRPATRALHKIESQLPADLQDNLAQLDETLAVQPAPATPLDGYADLYERARLAIARRRVLRCRYEPAASEQNEPASEFDLEPHCLLFSVRAWYVIGRRSDRNGAFRSLKLNRFSRMSPTERPFTPDPEFNLDDFLGNAWRMIPAGEDTDITLHISAEFATTIADTQWHRTQCVRFHDDDSCTFQCTVAGFSEIEWWILSMGPHCKVLEPPELARRIATLAHQTTTLYPRPRPRKK